MSFWGKVFLPSHAGLFVLFSPDRFLAFSSILHLGRLRGGQGFVLARVFWLVARLNGMCPAVIAAFHFMLFWPPARRAGVRACSCIRACRSIERYVPCGHEGFSFSAVLAASGGGRWGPVRGCRPSEAPSALPPDDPAGLVAYLHSHGLALRGFPYAVIPRGLRGLRSGSFLAALGDLPTRRAMPAHAFA